MKQGIAIVDAGHAGSRAAASLSGGKECCSPASIPTSVLGDIVRRVELSG